jgi:ABC-type multidrug transport system ATPase subunit
VVGTSNEDDVEYESDDTTSIDDVKTDYDTQHGLDLSFENLELIVTKSKSSSSSSSTDRTYKILDGSIRGRARPGRLLAIMGPSGCGKSSIVHALAGRIKESTKLSLFGTRYINGQPIISKRDEETMLHCCALVEQDVTFFPYMTVQETISFRVELQFGNTISRTEREQIVSNVLQQMSLTNVANTIVGNNKVRGISGGERKRLSIAIELIVSPLILFLDEPTSGLDSTAATTLVQQLRTLATTYHTTIIAVIHQPSQHVFTMFDDLLLVGQGGKLMYYGERSKVRHYMEHHTGRKASNDIGTAEYILDCITIAPIIEYGEVSMNDAQVRFDKLATVAQKISIDLGIVDTSQSFSNKNKRIYKNNNKQQQRTKANIIKQFRLLLKRSIQEIVRGKTTIILKLIQQVTTAFIYGSIYSVNTNNQASIRDRFGLLNLLVIGTTNLALAQTIRSFPKEKIIVSTELASKLYNTIPYFIAKAISEIPVSGIISTIFGSVVYYLTGLDRTEKSKFPKFLSLLVLQGTVSEAAGLFVGSISPSSDIALALFPAIVVLSIIFDVRVHWLFVFCVCFLLLFLFVICYFFETDCQPK